MYTYIHNIYIYKLNVFKLPILLLLILDIFAHTYGSISASTSIELLPFREVTHLRTEIILDGLGRCKILN
jgi:hypothetical protein